jgi:hypothetical protein
LTAADIYGKPAKMPRTKLFPVRIVLPLTADMLARLDRVRGEEPRVDAIRAAIERELKRRERKK